MDFDLSDEQRQLGDNLARLMKGRYGFENRKAYGSAPLGFSEELWRLYAELGLLGALALVALFVAFGYRGLRAAYLSTDPFARFLALGASAASSSSSGPSDAFTRPPVFVLSLMATGLPPQISSRR